MWKWIQSGLGEAKRPAHLRVLVPALLCIMLLGCVPPGAPASTPLPLPTTIPALSTPATTLVPAITQPVPAPATAIFAAPSPTLIVKTPPSVPPTPTPSSTPVPLLSSENVGFSGQQRPIVAHHLGHGPRKVILIGGIHGGYEWNSILLAYELLTHFSERVELVPREITLIIIPSANPDGQAVVTGRSGPFTPAQVATDTVPGRFNARGVDLNRNWDCQWQPTALWRGTEVSAGSRPFSETESVALRDYLLRLRPVAVVWYHSAADAIFAAGCGTVDPDSRRLAEIYGQAADYPVYDEFTAYPITGDAGDWLTTIDIPNFTVELSTHEALDWERNLQGVWALLTVIAAEPPSVPTFPPGPSR